MAHGCWAVVEIVRDIVASLVRDEKKASAVALASCSKSLTEPALGEVWRSLSSLSPLVKCFPPDVWEIRGKERYLIFKRAPTQQEWIRFQKRYASKVQYLTQWRYDIALSSNALHLLQLYSTGGPLLPNLISLRWFGDEKYHLPFISLFISPSLMSIDIDVPRKASPMLPPILNKLSESSPDLREIQINGYDTSERVYHDTSMEEASSHILMNSNHRLRKFKVDSPISASALKRVIQLPSLEEFWLVAKSFQLPDPLPMFVFPSLRELDVDCEGDLTWLKLLPAIENPVLTIISIKCPATVVGRFVETLQLTVTGCGMHESLKGFTVQSPDDFQITPGIIGRILSFKQLTSLSFTLECSDLCLTSDLTDDDVDLLTKAMPCLESLNLGDSPCAVPSKITFKSLYTISRRCTQLTDLGIHFNPALFVKNASFESWDVALGLSDLKTPSSDLCPLTIIYVGKTPFPAGDNASSILALGLLGMFPCLQEVDYLDDSWREVGVLVEVFRLMGCSAFGKKGLY